METPAAADRSPGVLLRLAIALGVGAVAGGAVLLLTFRETGSDDVAYSLSGGSACLAIGIVIGLAVPPVGLLARWKPLLVALLLGTGLALLTLGFFWWLQHVVFPYKSNRDLNYLLGEVGGYAAPGVGLLTCGLVLVWSYFVQRSDDRDGFHRVAAAGAAPPRPFGFVAPLLLAAMVGAGVGLINAALTYVVLGTRGPTSELAGFLACGLACVSAGIAFLLICVITKNQTRPARLLATFLVLVGIALCGMGVLKWVA